MPRPPRADEAGALYHVLNRANARAQIFRKEADYEAFERVLSEGLERYEVELFCFQLMPNHWHLVLRPNRDGEMSRFLRWITATHTMRYHAHYHTSGAGHVYQGRFKSFPVQDDAIFLAVCRYVERNAARAGLSRQAENWRWGFAVAMAAKSRTGSVLALRVAYCPTAELGRESERTVDSRGAGGGAAVSPAGNTAGRVLLDRSNVAASGTGIHPASPRSSASAIGSQVGEQWIIKGVRTL